MVAFRPQLRSRIMQLSVDLLACKHCLWCSNLTWRRLSTTVSSWLSVNNYYELLGVKEDATLEQIKEAFFERSKKVNPERTPPPTGITRLLASQMGQQGSRQGMRVRMGRQEPQRFEKSEQVRYWEQFRYASPEEYAATRSEKKRRRNMRLLGYCMFIMLGSVVAHYVAFRSKGVHEEELLALTYQPLWVSPFNWMSRSLAKSCIYPGRRATVAPPASGLLQLSRVNGFKKQQELLRQKHAEFVEKYRLKHRGTDEK
nr:PREDICTED: dnaJ homolog subfamily C member 4 [Latimeria chalumnae]|eukprot:XP_005988959.1 PREDICTED: dnaJ homolog subfamily C member 4 [Latimeria chalumnae]